MQQTTVGEISDLAKIEADRFIHWQRLKGFGAMLSSREELLTHAVARQVALVVVRSIGGFEKEDAADKIANDRRADDAIAAMRRSTV